MDSRFPRVLPLALAAAFVLLASSFSHVAQAIPKAAEDENGTVSIAPDVPRPKAVAKSPKPEAKQSATSRKNIGKAGKSTKNVSSAKVTKAKTQKPVRGKK